MSVLALVSPRDAGRNGSRAVATGVFRPRLPPAFYIKEFGQLMIVSASDD